MKVIETVLSERQFLRRLEALCRTKTRFDKGYEDKDTFVTKRNDNKFWLGKHYALIGRTDGYAVDVLFGKYKITEEGRILITYRFGKRLTYMIPFFVAIVIGSFLWASVIYDAIIYGLPDLNGIAIAALCWALGLGGAFIRSKKERKALEAHLLRICKVED